jgi:hypothetical protein
VGLGGRLSTCCEVGRREVSGLRAMARDGEGEVMLREPRGLRDPRPEKQKKKKKRKRKKEKQERNPLRDGGEGEIRERKGVRV